MGLSPDAVLTHVRRDDGVDAAVRGWLAELRTFADGCAAHGAHVVLGGSFARGEPCLRRHDGVVTTASDFDLFVILPPGGGPDLGSLTPAVPRPSVYPFTARQAAGLATCLGAELVVHGRPLTAWSPGRGLEVTARDAAELMVYALVELFEQRLLTAPPHTLDGYVVSRPALLAVRSLRILAGAPAAGYHGPPPAGSGDHRLVERLLAWRDDPSRDDPPIDAGELVGLLAEALARHRSHGHLARHADAVEGSGFAARPDAPPVGAFQRSLLAGFDRVVEAVGKSGPGAAVVADVTARVGEQAPAYRRHLLRMKVGEDG